jgi:hypothetical protein
MINCEICNGSTEHNTYYKLVKRNKHCHVKSNCSLKEIHKHSLCFNCAFHSCKKKLHQFIAQTTHEKEQYIPENYFSSALSALSGHFNSFENTLRDIESRFKNDTNYKTEYQKINNKFKNDKENFDKVINYFKEYDKLITNNTNPQMRRY